MLFSPLMSPPKPLSDDIIEDLKDFLTEAKEDQREGYTLKAIARAQQRLLDALEEHKSSTAKRFDEHKERLAEQGYRLGSVEASFLDVKARIAKLEEAQHTMSEDSKLSMIEGLKKQIAEVRSDKKYWIRWVVGAVVGVVLGVVGSVIGATLKR